MVKGKISSMMPENKRELFESPRLAGCPGGMYRARVLRLGRLLDRASMMKVP
jgi:hypothetical protein